MEKVKRWTPEEDKILKECVEKYPTKTAAFKAASKKISRSANAIEQRWYAKNTVLTLYKQDGRGTLSRLLSQIRNIFTF